MKTKPIPVTVALIAGFITCLVAFFTHINRADFVKILFFVLVGFYIFGFIIKVVLDNSFRANDVSEEAGPNEEPDSDGEIPNNGENK